MKAFSRITLALITLAGLFFTPVTSFGIGIGDKAPAFSGGADLNGVEEGQFAIDLGSVLRGFGDLPVPVIAAIDGAALGDHAVRVRMSDRMLSFLLLDSGDAWRPEFPMTQGTWFTELWSKTYRATRAEFEIREGETTRVTLTATRR